MFIKYIKFSNFIIFIFAFFGSFFLYSIELSIFSGAEIKYELIDENFSDSFFLEKLSYASDVFFDKSEFFYLTNLKEGQQITLKDLKNACFYLKQKNRFEEILIKIEEGQLGKKIHFILKAFNIFNLLKIKGLIFGKDRYIQSYFLEYGDKFDIDKHEKSIKKIKKDFEKQGYFNIKVDSRFDHDKTNKSISVYLSINKGKSFRIGNIDFEIQNSFLNKSEFELLCNEIRLLLPKFSKNIYSWNLIKAEKKKLENYIRKKGFCFATTEIKQNINNDQNNVDLRIIIFLQKKREWKFIGNKYFSDSQLLDCILEQGRFSLELPPSILAQEICQIYKQKGFWQVSINAMEENDSYIFKINEGPRASIEKIIVNGCQFINSKNIINKFFKSLINAKFINDDKLSNSIDNLTAFYLKSGFWDIKIDKKIIPNKNGKCVIEISIDEGKRKYLKSIKVENFEEVESETIFSVFKNFNKSIPFDINILNEQHKWLTNYMKKKGCQNVVIKPDFIANDNLEISLIWKINFNENNIKFGRTIIHGNNSKIPFERIIRETNFHEDQPWEKGKLEDSYFELNNLKIFDSIQLYPANYSDLNDNKPTILKLFPDDPIEIRTRVGFEQVNQNLAFKGLGTYKIGGTFIYKNPFYFCDYFKIDADTSRFETNFIVQYQIPWILGLPIKTLFQLYFNKYEQPLFIGSDKNIYTASNIGFLTGFSKKYNKIINYGFNIGIEGTEITDLSIERAKAIDFSPKLLDKRVPYFFFEPNLMIDYLDDKLYPTRGSLTVFTFRGIFSLQDSKDYFLKFLIEQSCFSNVFNPVILATRFSFGHIFVDNFSHLMPPLRFYLGGSNTIRSYEPDFAPPLGSYIKENGEIQCVPQGGKTMFNANFELRIPAWKGLSIVLFQDIGFLFGKEMKLNMDELLTATGFGIRYATPIGPLRFDIGWRPKRHKEDCSFMWFITLGQAF